VRAASPLRRMGRHPDGYRSAMPAMAVTLSTLVAVIVIGHSVHGQPIQAWHIRGPGPRVLVVGCIHGNECSGVDVVDALARAHPREDLWLIPDLNPDGHAARTRGNAHGVDLNRSFPNGREPETRAAVALIRRIEPAVTIWYHQAEDRVRAWGKSKVAARRYARLAAMRYATVQWPSGAATRWQNTALGEKSFVVELPRERLTPWQLDRQVRACLRVALATP
jgi:protein MpaA